MQLQNGFKNALIVTTVTDCRDINCRCRIVVKVFQINNSGNSDDGGMINVTLKKLMFQKLMMDANGNNSNYDYGGPSVT